MAEFLNDFLLEFVALLLVQMRMIVRGEILICSWRHAHRCIAEAVRERFDLEKPTRQIIRRTQIIQNAMDGKEQRNWTKNKNS